MNRPDILRIWKVAYLSGRKISAVEDENSFFLVAEADGKAAGMCNVKLKRLRYILWCCRADSYIDDICILPIGFIWEWEGAV